MNNPKISIIVPVYNVEKYLSKCLNSLINQTLAELEILCVNDGSTDNSAKILADFAKMDSRIKVFFQENSGQSAARNLAIERATGEYLGFVDSDDWVDLDYFEKLYNTAKKYDCDIACAGFKRCKRFRSPIKKTFKETKIYSNINDKVLIDKLPNHNYLWNKIYRRDKWDFKFTEGRIFEDMAILIKILFKYDKMVTVPNTYYNYRKTQGSTVTLASKKSKEDFNWARKELYSFAEQNGITLPKNKSFNKKETFKFCGITILKIYHYRDVRKYKLCGFIPLLEYECW